MATNFFPRFGVAWKKFRPRTPCRPPFSHSLLIPHSSLLTPLVHMLALVLVLVLELLIRNPFL